MRILVVTSDVPFVQGGHRVFAHSLAEALCTAGHESEVMTTPTNRFGRQIQAYVANRLADVEYTGDGQLVDAVISLRYPAFVVKHARHRMWLTHLLREYYDLWPSFNVKLGWRQRAKERARRAVIRYLDAHALARLDRRFVISKTVQARLSRFLGVSSEVLYPPPKDRPYRTEGYEEFILAPSRLQPLKRQEMLLRALPLLPVSTRAVIVGAGPDRGRLEAIVHRLGVETRVSFAGYVSDARLVDLYARCRAVFFAPVDEDFGFITLEAFRSRKPVVTCVDSGGPTELVVHGESGLVAEPTPKAVADALATFMTSVDRGQRAGEAGFEATRGITWERAIETLLAS